MINLAQVAMFRAYIPRSRLPQPCACHFSVDVCLPRVFTKRAMARKKVSLEDMARSEHVFSSVIGRLLTAIG